MRSLATYGDGRDPSRWFQIPMRGNEIERLFVDLAVSVTARFQIPMRGNEFAYRCSDLDDSGWRVSNPHEG